MISEHSQDIIYNKLERYLKKIGAQELCTLKSQVKKYRKYLQNQKKMLLFSILNNILLFFPSETGGLFIGVSSTKTYLEQADNNLLRQKLWCIYFTAREILKWQKEMVNATAHQNILYSLKVMEKETVLTAVIQRQSLISPIMFQSFPANSNNDDYENIIRGLSLHII